ncbi:carbohydrate ABC transporter permease [Chloroflexi bacterium TSY]|nr:carbohydrate ABC transporter permease [Chloroflexi bacterium TSY]
MWIVGMVFVVCAVVPIYWMIASSFKPEGEIMTKTPVWIPRTLTLDHYRNVLERPILLWFNNTTIVALFTILLRVSFTSTTGYAFARLSFRGKNVLFVITLATLMIPGEVTLVPLYLVVGDLKLVGTLAGVIVPGIPSAFAVYVFRQFFLSLPKELEDAGFIDGCGVWGNFLRIALPLAFPVVIVIVILSFVDSWNALTWPLVVTDRDSQTLAVGLARFNPQMGVATLPSYVGPGMAAATLMTLPTLIVYFALQRYFVQGISTTGLNYPQKTCSVCKDFRRDSEVIEGTLTIE